MRLVPFVGLALLEKRWIRHKSLKWCSNRCFSSVSVCVGGLSVSNLVRALPHFCINIFIAPFIASFRSAPSSFTPQKWSLLFSFTDCSTLPYLLRLARKLDLFWLKQPKNVFLLPFFSVRLRHVMMSCPRFEGHSFNLGPEKTYIFRRRLLWRSHLLSEPKDLERSAGRSIDFLTYRSLPNEKSSPYIKNCNK